MALVVQQIYPVAHLPLVLGVLRRLEVATLIDRLIPPHPAHGLSCGRGVEALVLAILDGHHALYKVGKRLEERGMVFKMPAQTKAILGTDRVTGVQFADGEEIPADLVVMAVGIRPNFELARKAGLHCERGIVVSDTMQTYDGRIYAVGECVQHRRQVYGLVAPLFEQAKVCANHLAMKGFATYDGSVTSTKLKPAGE